MTVLNPLFRRIAVVPGLILIAGAVSAQNPEPDCPPDCRVSIEFPDDAKLPPSVDRPVLRTEAGARVEFGTRGPAQVIFVNPGKTPFVDRTGQPVYWFDVNRLMGQSLWIRKDENPCAPLEDDPGRSVCKYIVLDRTKVERPPLDPYIIILR